MRVLQKSKLVKGEKDSKPALLIIAKQKKWFRLCKISHNLKRTNLPKNLKAFSLTQPIVTHGTIKVNHFVLASLNPVSTYLAK